MGVAGRLKQLGKDGSGCIFGKITYLLGLPCLPAEPHFSAQMALPSLRAAAPLDLGMCWEVDMIQGSVIPKDRFFCFYE